MAHQHFTSEILNWKKKHFFVMQAAI